jgi:hypothetical protein
METCAICCVIAQPTKAVQLACQHGWYCDECMKKYAESRLSAGDVSLTCPRCREPIQDYILKNFPLIREFMSKNILARFHDRSLKKAIATEPSLFNCPTPDCNFCVSLDDNEEPWLQNCPKCGKGSCLRCSAQPYHEGVSCQAHSLRSKSPRQQCAEVSIKTWMDKTGTKQCPQCRMGITKEDLSKQRTQETECHKMMCQQCHTRFCFKCLTVLTDTFTCGCTMDAHGFVNPVTGSFVAHLAEHAVAAPSNPSASSRSRSH